MIHKQESFPLNIFLTSLCETFYAQKWKGEPDPVKKVYQAADD